VASEVCRKSGAGTRTAGEHAYRDHDSSHLKDSTVSPMLTLLPNISGWQSMAMQYRKAWYPQYSFGVVRNDAS
jgi:hypothetical protein